MIKNKRAKDIVSSFTISNTEYANKSKKKLNNKNQVSAFLGDVKELIVLLAIEVGEGKIKNVDDVILYCYDRFGALRESENIWDREIALKLSNLIVIVGLMQEMENGKELFLTLLNHSGRCWKGYKKALEQRNKKKVDYRKFKIIPTSQTTGQNVVVDAIITKKKENGSLEFLSGFSIKFNGKTNKDITLKEGSWKTNVSAYYKRSNSEKLVEIGEKIERIYDKSKKEVEGKNIPTADFVKLVSGRINVLYEKSFGFNRYNDKTGEDNRTLEQIYLTNDLYDLMVNRFLGFHDDYRFKDVILTVTSINNDDSVSFYQTKTTDLKNVFNDWLEKGPKHIRMKKSHEYIGIDEKKYWSYNPMEFIGGPAEENKIWLRQEARYSTKIGVKLRSPFGFMEYLFRVADEKDQKENKSLELLNEYDCFTGDYGRLLVKGLYLKPGMETDKVVFGLFRPGAKYVSKYVDREGEVQYVYPTSEKTNEKNMEKKDHSIRKEGFSKMRLDSSEENYKMIFNQVLKEIPDEFLINIECGIKSIRITKDTEVFLDFLGVSKEQRKNEEFMLSSATYNVSRGLLAYNVSNFPTDASEIQIKRLMLHEVMHGFYFGIERLKQNISLEADDFLNIDKKYKKSCIDFIKKFTKIDEEIRDSIEVNISNYKNEEQIEAKIQEMEKVFVSFYAALNDIEHFAEAASFYFIFPEVLSKKEKNVFDLFNDFFGKY